MRQLARLLERDPILPKREQMRWVIQAERNYSRLLSPSPQPPAGAAIETKPPPAKRRRGLPWGRRKSKANPSGQVSVPQVSQGSATRPLAI